MTKSNQKRPDPKKDQKVPVSKGHENTTSVDLAKIDTNFRTQLRCKLNQEIVDTYAEAMKGGVIFPPVVLFASGENYYIGDGFHRIEAAMKICRKVIEA
jgi:ParB-like chromosome segregation protein Spo0J